MKTPKKNRGFSFVEYKDHKAAAMARRKLMPGRIQLWGHQIAVDWAEPEIEVDERNSLISRSESKIIHQSHSHGVFYMVKIALFG